MENYHRPNLGVRPLGGKTSMGQFEWMTPKLVAFVEETKDLLPIDSNDKAALLRAAHVRMNPKLAGIFDSLGLPF